MLFNASVGLRGQVSKMRQHYAKNTLFSYCLKRREDSEGIKMAQ